MFFILYESGDADYIGHLLANGRIKVNIKGDSEPTARAAANYQRDTKIYGKIYYLLVCPD